MVGVRQRRQKTFGSQQQEASGVMRMVGSIGSCVANAGVRPNEGADPPMHPRMRRIGACSESQALVSVMPISGRASLSSTPLEGGLRGQADGCLCHGISFPSTIIANWKSGHQPSYFCTHSSLACAVLAIGQDSTSGRHNVYHLWPHQYHFQKLAATFEILPNCVCLYSGTSRSETVGPSA